MSSTVFVSIALHGLIALVPVNVGSDGILAPGGAAEGGANHMAALLVDAHDPGVVDQSIKCIARHDPRLVFSIPDSSVPVCGDLGWCEALPAPLSGPRRCSCVPVGKKIWLTPESSPEPRTHFKQWATDDFPPDPKPDFSYFPNLAHFGKHLDPIFLKNTADPFELERINRDLAARMVFPFDGLTTCALAVRPGEGQQENAHSFGFRKLNELTDSQIQPHQAVAQRLLAKHTYQIAEQPLELHMSDLDGHNEVTIMLAQSGNVEIELSNERKHLELDHPCNDGVGRDFALFYKLATEPELDWTVVPLPHLMPTVARKSDLVEDPACSLQPDKGMMSRPVCTMASFIQ
jgi:hypothetical protein